ncbi:MAG: aminotransferase class V-fold PLP-dependent enzyme [Oscillospiraceae bacterium]|nr:aminotransferase class V-fold PLP-dependent enzyme [Oscillospiraceae bacterium]
MNTPIYDYLIKYAQSGTLRLHMPGHKGKVRDNVLSRLNALDITEITGAGNLFEYEGIIAQSEKNATELFSTAATYYMTQGSTLGIQTMLAVMKYDGRQVIAVRNAHRAFLSACVLLGIDVDWVFPVYSDSIISGAIDLRDVEESLKKHKRSCLYVTSPDYFGVMADIKSLAQLCHRYDCKLIVDNAHGACLAFYEENRHPVHLGADICCDSAHKMFPAFTGAAYLHFADRKYAQGAKEIMTLFASTSPSYLITCSLDLCNVFLNDEIRQRLMQRTIWINALRESLEDRYCFEAHDGEPLHLTVNAKKSGIDGMMLAGMLRENNIEYEYADNTHIIMLFSPCDEYEDFLRLGQVLEKIKFEKQSFESERISFPVPEKVMSIRDAAFSKQSDMETENSLGRICAAVNVPCPPAIPVAVSGERISEKCIEVMKYYGINKIRVVDER